MWFWFGGSLHRRVTYWRSRLSGSSAGNSASPPLQNFHLTRQFCNFVIEVISITPAAAIHYGCINQPRERNKRPDNQAQEKVFHR